MEANGLSQIWEQILRVIGSIVLAVVFIQAGYGIVWAAAGASFGGVLGAVAAALVMLYYGVKLRREAKAEGVRVLAGAAAGGGGDVQAVPIDSSPAGAIDPDSKRSILRAILKLSVPVSITALAVPAVYFIDTMVTIPLLRGSVGAELANEMRGWLTGRAQTIAGIPVIFAIALSQSILPIISAAFAKGDKQEVDRQTSLVLLVSLISGLPVIVVLAACAFPLNTFLFDDAEGTWVIIALVCSVLFQIIMMVTNSVLLGFGRADLPMKHIAVGVAVKLLLSFALAPFFGIYGIVAATASCFAVTMVLNLLSLRRLASYTVLGRRTAPFTATVMFQAAIGAAVAWALYTYLHPFGIPFWNAFLQTAIAAAVTAAVYPVLLLRTRAFTPEDIASMPEKLRRLWNRAEPVLRKLRII